MNKLNIRGALVVLEGCDRSGKSTLSSKIANTLRSEGRNVELMHFPDRSTFIGSCIENYLQNKVDMSDEAIHLLFSANRWELVPKMKQLLNSGTTLIVDRYAYSGVAFSSAKHSMNITWCKQSDVGLPRPDLVLFLDLPIEVALQRNGFGIERYETSKFQALVRENYMQLLDEDWKKVNADVTPEVLHDTVMKDIRNVLSKINKENSEIRKLWC